MTVPPTLGTAGHALWRSVVGQKYVLRPDEMATLEDACRIEDIVSALDEAWAEDGRPMTTKGSMGQLVIHPLIGEIRAQRMAKNALWRQLKLPDIVGAAAADDGSVKARKAATARWERGA